MSKRGDEWDVFCDQVFHHIESYTLAQYGDKGEDLASEYTVERCLQQVEKYLKRHGKNQREGQDKLDLIKMAHYIQIAWTIENDIRS